MNSSADQNKCKRQATFLIVHGLSEYGARYEEMATYLRSDGFGVDYWDLPGHGNRRRLRPDSHCWFGDFLRETEEHIDALRNQKQDVLLFGHSMGGTIVLKYLQLRGLDKLLGAAVVAPFLAPSGWAQLTFFKGINLLTKCFPQGYMPGKNLASNLTSDPEKQKEYRRDKKILNRVPFDLFLELHRAGADLFNHRFADLSSLYFSYGEEDPVCSPEVFRHFLRNNNITDEHVRTWPNARHEPANEQIRTDFFKTLCEWGHRLASTRSPPRHSPLP